VVLMSAMSPSASEPFEKPDVKRGGDGGFCIKRLGSVGAQ
jgi:hypothetical protein